MDEKLTLKIPIDTYKSRVLNFVNKLQERNVEILNFDHSGSWYVTLSGKNDLEYMHIFFYTDNSSQAFFTFSKSGKGNINVLVWPQSGMHDLSPIYGELHGLSSKIDYHDPANTCLSVDQMFETALRWDSMCREEESNFE